MNENNINVKLDVRVYPLENPAGNTLAFANVGVDDLVAVSGVRVVNGTNGLFVAMPQSRDNNGEYHDIAFPVNGDLRRALNKAVLEEYNEPTYDENGKNAGRQVVAPVNVERGESLSVKVYPTKEPQGGAAAFAKVGIENLMVITGIRVVNNQHGMFVDMPQTKDKNGDYHDVAFPVNEELRKEINKAVRAEYRAVQAERKQSIGERLDAGIREAAQNFSRTAQPAAAKGSPGLGD